EPVSNSPYDPYENLLDEVDQLLGEIKDDDDVAPAGPAGARRPPSSRRDVDTSDGEQDTPLMRSSKQQRASGPGREDLELQLDNEDDDDLARLLND
ncbi:hypothetical protein LPJ61_003192, partial [Coemansia biformis]